MFRLVHNSPARGYYIVWSIVLKTCSLVVLTASSLQIAWQGSESLAGEATGVSHPSFEAFKVQRDSLQREVTLYPHDADRHNRLGLVLLELQDFDKAVTEFRISSKLRPESLTFAVDLALGLTKIGALDEALLLYEDLISRNPTAPELYSNYGLALWQKSAADRTLNLEPAIAAFQKSIQYRPGDAGLHNNLGMVLKEKGDLEGAISEFRRAIELKPGFAISHANLGAALRLIGRNEEALNEVRAALAHSPEHAEAHYLMASLLRDSGNLESAAEEFRLTIALKSDHAEAYYNLAAVLKRLNRPTEASLAHEKFLLLSQASKSAYNARLHNSRGVQAASAGNLELAIEEFSSAVQADTRFADAHNNLGWTLVRKQDLPSAIREFRQAILLRDDYAMAYYNLGLALWSTGQKQDAEGALRKANRLDPSLILPKFLAVLEKKGE